MKWVSREGLNLGTLNITPAHVVQPTLEVDLRHNVAPSFHFVF